MTCSAVQEDNFLDCAFFLFKFFEEKNEETIKLTIGDRIKHDATLPC